MSDDLFVFLVCQVDTEPLVKRWFASRLPGARFAFSRPGLLTYKLPDDSIDTLTTIGTLPLLRTFGRSLGMVAGDRAALLGELAKNPVASECRVWHLWARDRARVGEFEFEPFADGARELECQWLAEQLGPTPAPLCNVPANRGDRVLDLIAVDPDRWLIGTHVATGPASCWVGGVPPLTRREVISRAYYKLDEAIRWTQLPLRKGDVALELGAAPGGACQLLLEKGLHVSGVDPAEIDPRVAEHPHFEHLKMRGGDLKKRGLKQVDWLICDANLVPDRTLDEVEPIVTSPHVNLKGVVLTLKMAQWEYFDRLDDFVARIRSWGWRQIKVRHRAFDRQEIVVVAWT
ncbi:MAG: hypothetical protein KDA83_11725 [Planctomycetales bacterium]|nr:hypothetical protein [Planctomycetales bacterium]